MAQCKMVQFQNSPDGGGLFCFEGNDIDMLAQDVQTFFISQGYRLESGSTEDGTYGVGSDLLRILFGAFVKRYKFDFAIQPKDKHVWLRISKGMSGAMGGAIGYVKMNKELARVMQGLHAHFS